MDKINRRWFIKRSITAAGCVAAMPMCPNLNAEAASVEPVETGRIGQHGISLSRFAQGTWHSRLGASFRSDQTGYQNFDRLLRHGFDRGINFWDLADIYGSHQYTARTLRSFPREKLVLLSKLWPEPMKWKPENDPQEDFDRIRLEIGTDYIDILLIHCMTTTDWPGAEKGLDGLLF